VAEAFRRALEPILAPGTTAVVTEDSLAGGGARRALTVVESDGNRRR
jgi:hypothetical protein